MKIFKRILSLSLVLCLVFGICACTGEQVSIGENGNWFIGGTDTGVAAGGVDGTNGKDGKELTVESFKKVVTSGNTDTYKIEFSDGTSETLQLTNGVTPVIVGFVPVGAPANGMRTYELSFMDGTKVNFNFQMGKDGVDGKNTIENFNIIYSATIGNDVITKTADTVKDGGRLELESNTVISNKHLTASFNLNKLDAGKSVSIGHGDNEYASSYITIDEKYVRFTRYYTQTNNAEVKIEHGLKNISGYLRVVIDTTYANATVQLMTPTGEICVIENQAWEGRQGEIFISPLGLDITDVKLSWSCDDYKNDIYMIGDSYFNVKDPSRWPSYLIKNGYTNNLMLGYPGMASPHGITEFEQALKHGTPKFAFWCMGMNDPDKNGTVSETWLSSTKRFLELCAEKGITPIISTIPTCGVRNPDTGAYEILHNNNYKNEQVLDWVENGYKNADDEILFEAGEIRYVDFANAVVKDSDTGEWYKDMLSSDNIHPAKLGAQALYLQALIDFPELMQK